LSALLALGGRLYACFFSLSSEFDKAQPHTLDKKTKK